MAMAAPLAGEAAAGGAASAESGAATLRPNAYSGGSTMAVDRQNRPPRAKKAPAAPKPAPAAPAAPPASTPEEAPEEDQGRRRLPQLPNPAGTVREGSWVVLGFLAWVWVALPFIKNGPGGVRDVLAAKFLNRTTGGNP